MDRPKFNRQCVSRGNNRAEADSCNKSWPLFRTLVFYQHLHQFRPYCPPMTGQRLPLWATFSIPLLHPQ